MGFRTIVRSSAGPMDEAHIVHGLLGPDGESSVEDSAGARGSFAARLRRAVDRALDRASIVDDRTDPVIAAEFEGIYRKCRDFSATSLERMYGLYQGVRYVLNSGIPGDFVECGVGRGGSSMAMALTLLEARAVDRTIYLYDTFEGMTAPTSVDVATDSGRSANALWPSTRRPGGSRWDYSPIEEVRRNLAGTGYPDDKLRFVKGPVEQTIPGTVPEKIALLRLDTDWYESTRHELHHLYPLLEPAGVLIVDDYGHWAGARRAVDEYFAARPILLNRLDYTGRIGVKR